jgi:YidC/Oxa1 family membrane protein insertase
VLAEIAPFQWLLDGIGTILAWLYDVVGNFGIAIIILTILFRIVLLPIGIKQIKSMQLMQALQPKIKEIQKKYKGDRQKASDETMKLYQQYGANPLSGCLITLLQFPILIAMYSVIRAPIPYAETDPAKPAGVDCSAAAERPLPETCFRNNHLPPDSQLYADITEHNDTGQHFGLMNLQCSASQSGKTVPVLNTARRPSGQTLNCGDSTADRIPYFVLLALMIGSTYYSSRQTQRATPASAQNSSTQIITRIMPLTFGIFGFAFPAGLVLYWTVSSSFQIGQQSVMLRLGHIGPEAMDRRLSQMREKAAAKGDKPRGGFMGGLMERADQERKRRQPPPSSTPRKPPPRTSGKGGKTGGGAKPRPKGGGSGRPRGSGPNRSNRPKGSGK